MNSRATTLIVMIATLVLASRMTAAEDRFPLQFRNESLSWLKPDRSRDVATQFVSNRGSGKPSNTHDADPGTPVITGNESFHDVNPVFQDSVETSESANAQPTGFLAEQVCSEQVSSDTVDCDLPLVRHRDACYQGTQVNYGSIGDNPDTGITVRTVDTYATFAVPLGSMENVISFIPYFRADLLQAPALFDVPDEVFDTGVKALWRRPINDRLSSLIVVTPSVRSDFRTGDGAFRLFGMGLLTWQWVPKTLAVSGGAVYTGRADFPVLPAMGLLWTPTPRWKYDIQFPSPRISYRLAKSGANHETWTYLSGVFGGNTWAVKRTGGAADELTLSDLRLVLGVEHLQPQNRAVFVEVGYIFGRSMEYTTVPFQQDLDAAVMLRTGFSF